jgi:hypothetical protein
MKLICECGKEQTIHCPPEFGVTMGFAIGHDHPGNPPSTIKAVCSCGAERVLGPGAAPKPKTSAGIFAQGLSDGQWYEKHAACEAN